MVVIPIANGAVHARGAEDRAMSLEVASFVVRDIQFSENERFEDGVLYVDREHVRDTCMAGGAFEDVDVQVVRPGDDVRIIHAMDAVEPRYNFGNGTAFPGFVGPQKTVGVGRTHRLSGMAIVSAGDAVVGEATYWREAILDMVGAGAEMTPLAATVNLLLVFTPRREYVDPQHPEAVGGASSMVGSGLALRYNRSVRKAQLTLAVQLAQMTAGATPASTEIFSLRPGEASLPRVVYLYAGPDSVYGRSAEGLPTLIHPNEILDGAVVNTNSNSFAAARLTTFSNQNHAIVRELYRRHSHDFNFAGSIIYTATSDMVEHKEMLAEYVVKLVRLLGADAVCATSPTGGHPLVDHMLICQKLERLGIKMVSVMTESYGTPEDLGFVHSVPEAVAIVSAGRSSQAIRLSRRARLLGGEQFFDMEAAPQGDLNVMIRYLIGACTATGEGRVAARQY